MGQGVQLDIGLSAVEAEDFAEKLMAAWLECDRLHPHLAIQEAALAKRKWWYPSEIKRRANMRKML